MKNAELIARLRLGASISRERKLNQGYDAVADEAADAIEALEAEVERLKAAQQAQPEPSEMTTERESYIAGLESRTHEMRKKIEQLDYELRVARSSQERATYTPPKIIDPDAPHPCFN